MFVLSKDHPLFKDSKVGDVLTMRGKITDKGEHATVEIDHVEATVEAPKVEKKKKMTALEYLSQVKRKTAAV